MKKTALLLSLLLLVSLLLSSCRPATLSDLSDEKLLSFLESNSIAADADDLPSIRNWIERLEDDPNWILIVSLTDTLELFQSVRAAVLDYYGIRLAQ